MPEETYHRDDFDYELAWAELRSERSPIVPPREEVGSGHWLVLRERLLETFERARLTVPARRPMTAEELRHHARRTLVVLFDDRSTCLEVFQIPDDEVDSELAGDGERADGLDEACLERVRGEWATYRVARYGGAGDRCRQAVDTRLLDTRIDRVVVLRRYG